MADDKKKEAVTPAPAEEVEQPTWPQGEDYDPREDSGPARPEDEVEK